MKKKYHITRNEEFQKIISTGRHAIDKRFVVYYLPASFDYDRIGLSVSKKIGNAVVRNKVKRQLRMMVDEFSDFQRGVDLIIIVRKEYLNHDYDDNKKDLSALCNSVYNKHGQTN